jgi:hypothetical protein
MARDAVRAAAEPDGEYAMSYKTVILMTNCW